MKKILILFTYIFVVFYNITNADIKNATASAIISKDLTIEEIAQLSFGKVEKKYADTVIQLNSDGTASVLSGDFVPHGSHSLGVFKLKGEPNNTIGTISVDSTGIVTRPGGYTFNTTYAIDTPPAILNSSGEATFKVIGSIEIKAWAIVGAYSGTYNITYSY